MYQHKAEEVCTPKTGYITGEVYCALHGRAAGWPCRGPQSSDESARTEYEALLKQGEEYAKRPAPSYFDHVCGHDYDPLCSGCKTAYGDAGLDY